SLAPVRERIAACGLAQVSRRPTSEAAPRGERRLSPHVKAGAPRGMQQTAHARLLLVLVAEEGAYGAPPQPRPEEGSDHGNEQQQRPRQSAQTAGQQLVEQQSPPSRLPWPDQPS